MDDFKFRVWDTDNLLYDKQMLYMEDLIEENIKNDGRYIEKVLNILIYINNTRYKLMNYTGLKRQKWQRDL